MSFSGILIRLIRKLTFGSSVVGRELDQLDDTQPIPLCELNTIRSSPSLAFALTPEGFHYNQEVGVAKWHNPSLLQIPDIADYIETHKIFSSLTLTGAIYIGCKRVFHLGPKGLELRTHKTADNMWVICTPLENVFSIEHSITLALTNLLIMIDGLYEDVLSYPTIYDAAKESLWSQYGLYDYFLRVDNPPNLHS